LTALIGLRAAWLAETSPDRIKASNSLLWTSAPAAAVRLRGVAAFWFFKGLLQPGIHRDAKYRIPNFDERR
jgi:hypothetical protein